MPKQSALVPSARPGSEARGGRKALRAARDEMYRRHLMDAAERVFSEQGFSSAKMQEVAAAAAVSLSTLYRVFPHKVDLYQAIVDARGTELLEQVGFAMRGLGNEALTPLSVILHGVATHLRYFLDHPAFLKMSLLRGQLWYHRASRASDAQKDQWARGQGLMEAAFVLGAREGLFVDEDPGSQGRAMIALQQTRLANWVRRGMHESHDQVIATNQAEFVRTFCLPTVAGRVLSEDGQRVLPETLSMPAAPAPGSTKESS